MMNCQDCNIVILDSPEQKLLHAIFGQPYDVCEECVYVRQLPKCPKPTCRKPLKLQVNGFCLSCWQEANTSNG